MKKFTPLGKKFVPGCALFIVLIVLNAFAPAHNSPDKSNLNSNIGQDEIITGTVSDLGGPIPGVLVQVKNTRISALTDQNGYYSIMAAPGDILVFSYPGHETIEVEVGIDPIIDVELYEAVALEEAVINAGYYQVKDRERTGSISRITAEEIENQPVGNVLAAIQGRMAGVGIIQNSGVPGGGFDIKIRGENSLRHYDGNYPLYIIDGIPILPQSPSILSSTILPLNDVNPLNALNPNDIESVEVLKDADATAIYGSRGANGVILITTKKGKTGRTSFSLNTRYGISRVVSKMKMMDTPTYLEMRRQAFENDGITEIPEYAYDINGIWDENRYTDWQKKLIGKTATDSNIQFSINGGNEQTNFLVSAGHSEQTTVFANDSHYKTNQLSGNLNHRSQNSKLELNFSTFFSTQSNNVLNTDMTLNALSLSPNAPKLYNEDGTLNWENNTFENPLAAFESTYSSKGENFQSSLNLGYAFLPYLKFKLNTGIHRSSYEELSLNPHTMYNPAYGLTPANSMAFQNTNKKFSYLFEPQLNFTKTFEKHELDVLAGGTFQQTLNSVTGIQGYGFQSNAFITNFSAAQIVMVYPNNKTEYNYGAVFGRINYQYDNKYILNLTGRRDGSSRFGPNNRFANFGAVGIAWIFSRESFLKDITWLSFGKLRGSYGITGSDLIGDYQYLDTYSITGNNYDGYSSLNPTRLYNPQYSWEKTRKLEFAITIGLFRERLNLEAAWYRNRSGSQLVGIPLPGTTGFNIVQSNLAAEVENRGWEFDLNVTPIKTADFQWESHLNLSFPKNELLSFPGLDGSTYANRYVIGMPVSIAKLYQYEGINPETGLFVFKDFNGDGIISSPEDNLVNEEIGVKYFGGISTSLTYKRFGFSFLIQYVNQRQWNYNSQMPTPGIMYNQPVEVSNVWSETNPNGIYMPYSSGADPIKNELYNHFHNSTAAVGDASFLRLKNVQLNYRLPTKGILQDVMVYFQGQNLLTLTNYFGLDPEFVLTGFLPPLKTYSLGVQFNF